MPIRFSFDSTQYEVDTPAEAIQLKRELAREPRHPQVVPVPVPVVRPPVPRTTPTSLFRVRTGSVSPARAIFKDDHYPAFEAMYKAGDAGVTTDRMVILMNLRVYKSMPPVVGAWRKRARNIELDLNDYLEIERGFAHGKPTTVYRLNERGRAVLKPDTETARNANGDAGRS